MHKNKISNLIYLDKKNPIENSALIEDSDIILLYEPRNSSELTEKYKQLSMGIISPKEIETSYSNANLNLFYDTKKTIIPFNPQIDLATHSPYHRLFHKTNEFEQEITNNFIHGDCYKALNLCKASLETYRQSFLYLYSFLNYQLENIEESIQAYNQSLAYQNKNILIISSPKILEFKFVYPDLISRQYQTESHFHLSIRHEIFRRKILNLEIKENMFNAYLLECAIKKSSNQDHVDYCKSPIYHLREKILSIDETKLQELSQSNSNLLEMINEI